MSMGFLPAIPVVTKLPSDPKDVDEARIVEPEVDDTTERVQVGEPVGRSDPEADAIRSTRVGGTRVNVAIWGHEATVAMNDLVFREVAVIEPADIVAKGFDELIDDKEENVKILVRP
jgi:(R,R)-butanediol dehydrogenase/meso-butanediol dehydrogenase/diacetyl reductase